MDVTENALALGVDVGGTHMRVAVLDGVGRVVKAKRYNLDDRTPAALLALMERGRTELGVDPRDPMPMGVGLAAQIWAETGMVAVAPNLGWQDVPFGAMLRERFSQRVRMVNDLNAITVGEAIRGAGEGAADVMCVFVGTGVGMGAVMGGKVVEGADGLATELGHIKVGPVEGGRRCGCGEVGCLEAYTSGRHLPDLLAERVARGVACALVASADTPAITAGAIDAAVAQDDPAATLLWQDVGEVLARAIGNAVTLFNPRVLVLGGGVLTSAPRLKGKVVARLDHYTARPARQRLAVRDAALGDDAGVIGAALIALHDQKL